MYTFIEDGLAVHFDFPEGRIDLNEVLQVIGAAGRISLRQQTPVRVTIAGIDEVGMIEARHTPGRVFPPQTQTATYVWDIPPSTGYHVYVSSQASPYFRISIPGVIESFDRNVIAVSSEFADRFEILATVLFNIGPGMLVPCVTRVQMPADWRVFPEDYTAIRRVRDMLSKRPRVPKAIDFTAILTKLFGDKIAQAILKEIK